MFDLNFEVLRRKYNLNFILSYAHVYVDTYLIYVMSSDKVYVT